MGDSSEYVCTYDSWVSANDTLKFLSEQRRCDKETDSLRTFSFGSTYYICDDVKWGKDSVYTFKDTTQAYADSLDSLRTSNSCTEFSYIPRTTGYTLL